MYVELKMQYFKVDKIILEKVTWLDRLNESVMLRFMLVATGEPPGRIATWFPVQKRKTEIKTT